MCVEWKKHQIVDDQKVKYLNNYSAHIVVPTLGLDSIILPGQFVVKWNHLANELRAEKCQISAPDEII